MRTFRRLMHLFKVSNMKFHNELLWLAKQLDRMPVSQEPSLWKALREQREESAGKPNVLKKRHVYITGEVQTIYKRTDLFSSVALLEDVLTLTSETNAHPALQWMDITYYPPNALTHVPKNKTLTLFAENRLPLWSRSLFMEKKISNVVVTESIVALARMDDVKQHLLDDFSYEFLLDDVVAQKELQAPSQQLFPEPPKQYVLQIMAMNAKQQKERALILDRMAAQMLNTYWLQNHPPIAKWLPVLMEEIKAFLAIQASNATNEKLMNAMKAWGKRDKRIN